jgi:glutathionylspermidine synthase
MQRHHRIPRPDWPAKVESVGLTFHSHETGPYWDESACYAFTAAEVTELESAGAELHQLYLRAAEVVIQRGWWSRLAIPEPAVPAILASWERDDFSLYGRFDLAYDGQAPPKLLEYNADTPTALVEAAVAQWFWLQDTQPAADQFNSLHERLIEAWRRWAGATIHFSAVKDNLEDEQTVLYLRDTCEQAGVTTRSVAVEDIGWDARQECFVDLEGVPIRQAFKLYPWEWLWAEEFGKYLAREALQLVEPAWKMLLSNKAMLAVLWELFPEHPNLLPAYHESSPLGGCFVRKPLLGREGANITWFEQGVLVEETPGGYGEEGCIYQAPGAVPSFDGHHPVCGVWMVDHEPAGLGLREDTSRITSNLSRFVPHLIEPAKPTVLLAGNPP